MSFPVNLGEGILFFGALYKAVAIIMWYMPVAENYWDFFV